MPKLILATALFFLIVTPFARADHDRASFGGDITVNEGETVGDIACAFCSVHLHGDVRGDVAVFAGSVNVDPNLTVSGSTAIFGGNLNLGDQSEINGDVAIAAGNANLAPGAIIRGSHTILPSRIWLIIPFAPLLLVIGIIWLIIYLIRRNRYQFPVYPNGQGL